jgi:ABC-type Fe3+ transport system permease subunit
MPFLRRLHLWLGCFFAPILLFFVCTGWYQTVYHDRQKGLGDAETWVDKLRSIHVDQIYPAERSGTYSPELFKWFVVVMSIALILTVLIGIVLAFRFSRSKWPVALALLLGILVPATLLWLGQNR